MGGVWSLTYLEIILSYMVKKRPITKGGTYKMLPQIVVILSIYTFQVQSVIQSKHCYINT